MKALAIGTKRRIVGVAIVLLAFWPVAQHLLTDHFQMNHWRFAGWAMYTKPSPMPRVGIYSPDESFQLPLEVFVGWRDGDDALRDFFDRRKLWGELYHPDEVAAVALRHSPNLESVRIYVNTVTFVAGGHAAWRTSLYECDRDRCAAVYEGRAHGGAPTD